MLSLGGWLGVVGPPVRMAIHDDGCLSLSLCVALGTSEVPERPVAGEGGGCSSLRQKPNMNIIVVSFSLHLTRCRCRRDKRRSTLAPWR